MKKKLYFVCLFVCIPCCVQPLISEITVLMSPNKKQRIICCSEFHIDDPKNQIVLLQQKELILLAKKLDALLIVEDPYDFTSTGDKIRDQHIKEWIENQIAMDNFKREMAAQPDEENDPEAAEEEEEEGANKQEDFLHASVCNLTVKIATDAGVKAVSIDLRTPYSVSLGSMQSSISSAYCLEFFETLRQRVAQYNTLNPVLKAFYQDVAKKITRNAHDRLVYTLLQEMGQKPAAHIVELYDSRDNLKKLFSNKEEFEEVIELYGDRLLDAFLVRWVETSPSADIVVCAGVDHVNAVIKVLQDAGYSLVQHFGSPKSVQETVPVFVKRAQPLLEELNKFLQAPAAVKPRHKSEDKPKELTRGRKRSRSPSAEE